MSPIFRAKRLAEAQEAQQEIFWNQTPEKERTRSYDHTGTQGVTVSPTGSGPLEQGPSTECVRPPDGWADPDARTLTHLEA